VGNKKVGFIVSEFTRKKFFPKKSYKFLGKKFFTRFFGFSIFLGKKIGFYFWEGEKNRPFFTRVKIKNRLFYQGKSKKSSGVITL